MKKPARPTKWHVGDIWECRIESIRVVYEVKEVFDRGGAEFGGTMAHLRMISPFTPDKLVTQQKIPKDWKFLSCL